MRETERDRERDRDRVGVNVNLADVPSLVCSSLELPNQITIQTCCTRMEDNSKHKKTTRATEIKMSCIFT